MRIAHLMGTSLPTVGGAEIVLHNLAVEQARRGHRVTVVARWPVVGLVGRRLPYRVAPLLPTTFHHALNSDLTPQGHWLLRRQLELHQRRKRFDVWHVHMAHPVGWAAAGTLQASGVPAVLTSHGGDLMVEPGIGWGHRLDPDIDDRVRRTVTAYPAVTAMNAEIHRLFAELGVPEDRIHDIPNGIDVDRIGAHTVDGAAFRAHHGFPRDAELLLTVARYDPMKGLDLLPEVAARVARERPTARWLVLGQGTDVLRPELERRGLGAVVAFDTVRERRPSTASLPGPRALDAYAAADLFVLPSVVEGNPLVLLEAMAAGRATVGNDVPGVRDLVVPGRNGLLAEAGDADSLAVAVTRLLADSEERAAMGRRAREGSRRYSVAAMADAYEAVYRSLTAGEPA